MMTRIVEKGTEVDRIITQIANGQDPTPDQIDILTKDYDRHIIPKKRQRIGPIQIRVSEEGVVVITSKYRHVFGHA